MTWFLLGVLNILIFKQFLNNKPTIIQVETVCTLNLPAEAASAKCNKQGSYQGETELIGLVRC